MSQEIVTTISAALPNGADLTEDAPALAAALTAALDKAVELGGHEQRVSRVTITLEEQVDAWQGLIAPLAVVEVTTKLL